MTSKPLRPSRWRRRVLWCGGLLALVVVGYYIATSSLVMKSVVASRLGSALGGRIEAESISLDGGVLTMVRPRLVAPGVAGAGGEVFSAERIETRVNFAALWRGGPIVDEITLDSPVIRLSQSVDDGSVNVASLKPDASAGGAAPKVFPKITVRGGVIEVGEHVSDPALHSGVAAYTPLKRVQVEGDVVRSTTEDGVSVVTFRQIEAPGVPASPGSLMVEGRVSSEGVTLKLSNLKLQEATPDAVPSRLRESFRALAMSGEISGATLLYRFDGGAEVRVALADVAMTLPIIPEPHYDNHGVLNPVAEADRGRRPRMQRVKGELVLTDKGAKGTVRGEIEDLPYDVTFEVMGTHEDAPFTCRLVCNGFELKEHPEIVIFAPEIVRQRLAQFSNPTGTVNADMTIRRETAGGEVTVRGVFALSHGTAAFERFPYRFSEIEARAEFDEKRLRLTSVTGEAAGGVRLNATADISPLTDEAGVDVKVEVTGLPVNEVLHAAMKTRGKLIDELFNVAAYKRMTEAGLVISPARKSELEARVAELRANAALTPELQAELAGAVALLERPVFEPGGVGTVKVGVQREAGPAAIWRDQVTVHFDAVNVVPQAFAYPMHATDVTLVKNDFDATISGGFYRGLRGGEARIAARVNLEKFDAPGVPFVPDVEVDATGIPMDELLLFALPDATGLSPDGKPLRDLVGRLHVQGRGDAHAKVYQLPSGEPGYKVEINLTDASSRPRADGAPSRLLLTEVSGGIDVGHDGLDIDLSALLGAEGGDGSGTPATVRAGIKWSDESAEQERKIVVSLAARATGAKLSTPIEDIVAVFSPEAAEAITRTRLERQPSGVADVRCDLSKDGPDPMRIRSSVTNLRAAGVNAPGGRVEVDSLGGEIIHDRVGLEEKADTVRFKDFEAKVASAGVPAGTVLLRGGLLTDGNPASDEAGLTMELREGRWENSLVREAAAAFGPGAAAEFLRSSNSAGFFDLRLELEPEEAGGARWAASGTLTPRSWSGAVNGTPVSVNFAGGAAVDFTGTGGSIRGIVAEGPSWTVAAEGGWLRSADGGIAAQTTLGVDARTLSPDLEALLPEAVRGLIADLSLKGAGPVKAAGTSISLTFGPDGSLAAFKAGGQIEGEELSFETGIGVEHCRATVDFSAQRASASQPVTFEVFAQAPTLEVSGITMTDAKARIASGPAGDVLVPVFSADTHGGRVTGSASIAEPNARGQREFTAEAQGASIRFAPLLEDLQGSIPPVAAPSSGGEQPDGSRGVMDFGLTLGGVVNDPASRRGRGSVMIGDGRVVNMPLVVALVRFSNLQLPVDERLDYAQADFFFAGSKIELERAWISSPTVEIYGFGAVSWPDLLVDMRFRTRARNRIPLVSGVMEKIRNELVTATVHGTLAAPAVSVQALGGTTKLVKGIFGDEPTTEDRRLDQIESMAKRDPRRSRETAPDEVVAQPK